MISHDEATQRKILNRLKRARGQLDAVISAVEEQKSCRDVVTQLSAVTSALDRAGFAIVSTAMRECVVADAEGGAPEDGDDDRMTIDELEQLFMRLS
ncbi:metal-sensitive transcriptional regulator [Zhihengliuella halotolerans]|uniref:DNA-binding FrmR family transcriptional regulator n=1 Tax=Zhihengliuella halotolerans TaxID=370736 RepID=A0A4Q8AFS1_9MICC|nr:metal-sensitive transcriptional regulator [Zhihengliuella halotolerans]RZU62691.1 DNA-binding FrmR family transcriptional regulator [Zhihengliuella halotolerans]